MKFKKSMDNLLFFACCITVGFSSSLLASDCDTNLEVLVDKMKSSNKSLYINTADYFYTQERYNDNEGTEIVSESIDEAASIRKYGRIIPSKSESQYNKYTYEYNKSRRKNPRALTQLDINGKRVSSLIFRKNEKKCWKLESKIVFLIASEEQIKLAKIESHKVSKIDEFSAEVIPSNSPRNSKRSIAESQTRIFNTALLQFLADTGRYPTKEEGLNVLIFTPNGIKRMGLKRGGYLKYEVEGKRDPWGEEYNYLLKPCAHFVSYGEDKKSGGTGSAADIGSCSAK